MNMMHQVFLLQCLGMLLFAGSTLAETRVLEVEELVQEDAAYWGRLLRGGTWSASSLGSMPSAPVPSPTLAPNKSTMAPNTPPTPTTPPTSDLIRLSYQINPGDCDAIGGLGCSNVTGVLGDGGNPGFYVNCFDPTLDNYEVVSFDFWLFGPLPDNLFADVYEGSEADGPGRLRVSEGINSYKMDYNRFTLTSPQRFSESGFCIGVSSLSENDGFDVAVEDSGVQGAEEGFSYIKAPTCHILEFDLVGGVNYCIEALIRDAPTPARTLAPTPAPTTPKATPAPTPAPTQAPVLLS